VYVAPLAVRVSLYLDFEQVEGALDGALHEVVRPRLEAHPSAGRAPGVKTESVLYDVAKFVELCANANPNALEVLFADEGDWVFDTPAWRRLHADRRRFLTRKVQQTYLGYAMAQLRKIRTHRSWLLHPPSDKPTREAFGLPETGTMSRDDQNRIEQSIAHKARSYGIDTLELPKASRIAVRERLRALQRDALATSAEDLDEALRAVAVRALHLPEAVAEVLNAERRYRAALKHWESYQSWKAERNPVRAALEARHGYDTKHAAHLLRLMRTGLELLETGELRVRRPDAEGLAAVRDGSSTFDELLAEAASLEAKMHAAAAVSALPGSIDHAWVDGLVLELVRGGR
jgi:predicted nucleotidyltransferase